MITFQNIQTQQNEVIDLSFASFEDRIIEADEFTILPAVIDPHVHFRTPGLEYKEDWRHAAKAAIRGGCTMVFDMPNTIPPTFTVALLQEKKRIIDQQLAEVQIPLRYELFLGADKHHLSQIELAKSHAIGIKVFMGCSTGNLVIDDDESLHAVFSLAAKHDLLVAVHAEDEHLIRAHRENFKESLDYASHSILRDVSVAVRAVEKALLLAEQYGTKLYILHVSSAEEIDLIRAAKQKNLRVFAEVTPHHLFFNTSHYEHLQGKAVVNPPLRDKKHQEYLFNAIHERVIDTIGSDHAPHTIEEKSKAYGQCPSGMPGIEFMLPLLLNAYHQDRLQLNEIISLTSKRAREIFNLPHYEDWVIVDLAKVATVNHTESKCGFTPYQGLTLKGWPIYTIMRGRCYQS